MRVTAVVLGLVGSVGCVERDPGAVARIDGRRLSVERLAELMVLAQPMPLTPAAAHELATHWLHWNAFAARMAAGDSLLDSATVLRLMWYPARQAIVAQWRLRLLTRDGAAGDVGRTARFDSTYGAQILQARATRIRQGAAAVVRDVASNPWRDVTAETLATFVGGALDAAQLARHLRYLGPGTRSEITAASSDRIAQFVAGLVLEELMLQQADSADIRLGEAAFGALRAQCRGAVHALWRHTGLSPVALAGATATQAARDSVAARRVDEYLDAAAARRVPLEAVPPFLAVPLLEAADWDIAPALVDAAVERAQRLLRATR